MKKKKNGLVLLVPHNLRIQKVGKISRQTKCNRFDTVTTLLPDTIRLSVTVTDWTLCESAPHSLRSPSTFMTPAPIDWHRVCVDIASPLAALTTVA